MKKSYHVLYPVWRAMVNRCQNPKSTSYRFYGKRGIRVCKRWLESFENFLDDMGKRPFAGASIDRINRNGNYEPENCRWVTQKQQCRNSSNNRLLTLKAETRCISEWSEILSTPAARIHARKKLGWTDEDALLKPKWGLEIEFNGDKQTLREWAARVGLRPHTLWYRLKVGRWPLAQALLTPRMNHSECGKLCKIH